MLEILYISEREKSDKELLCRIKKDISDGKSITLLVPEQQVYSAELTLSYNNIISPDLEVVGFRRLCESVFRRFGGLAYNNITDGARLILMWKTLAELSPMLEEYKNVMLDDIDMIKSISAAVSEFSLYGITSKMLEDAAERLNDTKPKLSRKLRDLSLIAATNSALLKQEYNDPAEDTRRLAEMLDVNDYFGGRSVYIAHFVSFSLYEKKIIDNVISKAHEVCMIVDRDRFDKREIFKSLNETCAFVEKCAREAGVKTVIGGMDGDCEKSGRSPEIEYFSKNIWDFSAEKYDGECRDIRFAEAENAQDEARFVASSIAEKIREGGARYRDFAVIVRKSEDYEGIIDRALASYNIPYFLSVRGDIKMRPSIRMILLALKIRAHNWQSEDVISYMRCGFTGLSEEECDTLEQYAATWKISGKRWFDEHPWSMHPDGFGAKFTEETGKTLDTLNSYRAVLVTPLVRFFEIFEKEPTLRTVSEALYNFLTEIDLRKKLEISAAELRNKNRVSEADETVQIWNCFIESLDSLVTVAGEISCRATSYMKLLSAALELVNIGKIPSGIDEVMIGEASALRISGVKYVYVMGLNEGVFPASVHEDVILGDRDRRSLADAGIELSPESTQNARDEMFFFYLATCAAERELTITYNKSKNPSTFLASAKALFEEKALCEIKVSELDSEDFVWSDLSALEYAVSLGEGNGEIASYIKEYLRKRGNIGFYEESDLIRGEYRYTGDKKLFGDYMGLTQARLESYAMCPFAYFCKYVMSLAEPASNEASSADIGNFVHLFLESFMSRAFENGKILPGDKLESAFDESMELCRASLGAIAKEPRVENLILRIENTLKIVTESLADEFSVSKFKPEFFELQIGKDSLRPITVELPDGGKVGVYGVIDRVDTYEQDGKVYVRVVDYKTGKKVFSREDISHGINLQMLLYLESVCATSDKDFLEKLGCAPEEKPIPAGVLYFSTKMPDAKSVTGEDYDGDTLDGEIKKKLKRIGLVCTDGEILSAMDPNMGGVFIPVTVNKDGSVSKRSEKNMVDSFDDLFGQINNTVVDIACDMKSGRADADPLKTNNHDACKYCSMNTVCRRKAYCAENSEILHGIPDSEYGSEGGGDND